MGGKQYFTLPELRRFFEELPSVLDVWPDDQNPDIREFGIQVVYAEEVAEVVETAAERVLQQRLSACQEADRRYWRPIVAELRAFRSRNQLMQEGAIV
jgi:hypothetical protein